MAHSLSPASFHSYQCSPGAESQQRHVGYSNSNSYRQHHREKEKTNRLRLSSLKGKSWSSFADAIGCESSDDDSEGDTADDDPLASSTNRHQKRGSIVRLKKRDSALYGICPMTDPFAVVVCRHCRMVLKAPSLKSHIDRHEKDRKHDYGDAVVKLEKLSNSSERSSDKTSSVTEKFDKISVVHEKPAPVVASFSGAIEKTEKVEKSSVDGRQRHRHFQRKSTTPSENSNDGIQLDPVPSATESSSSGNSPQPPRRRKRKLVEEAVETFQNSPTPPTTCIIVEPSEIVLRDPSSPPPLAPIAQPSVWIVTPAQPSVTIIDGSFVVKPLVEQDEPEIDLKDLKVLKPVVKETMQETPTLLTPSNFYTTQPRPLTVNTFNMRKLNAQRYVMATQRKLIELGRNLRTEEKVVGGKSQPKTWSFIERSQVFIPFRVTH